MNPALRDPAVDEAGPRLVEDAKGLAPAPRSARAKVGQLFYSFAKRLHDSDLFVSFAVRVFRALQRVGVSVSPNHFYWPIPDIRQLERRPWPTKSLPVGVDLQLEKQLEFANQIAAQYRHEWRFPEHASASAEYHYHNGFFESVDAEVAYSFVRQYQPARIIEVGGGFSTRLLASALRANWETDGKRGELISIDPFPDRILVDGVRGLNRQIAKPVQEANLDLFLSLRENDILFLDSSHVVSVGSDAVYEYLDIIPRLNKGVLIHAHDIFLPSDYPRESVLRNLTFWSEQYLLQTFLSFNSNFEVLWGSSAMQLFHPTVLEAVFPAWRDSYQKIPEKKRRFVPTLDKERVWPSSFWMRRVQ